jgi:hypothetical protein
MVRLRGLLSEQRGNVESALVLVPLLILFLIGMQLSLAVHERNVERMKVQNEASTRAISGEFEDGDEFLHIESSGDSQNLDLLITHRESSVRDLLPSFLNGGSADRRVDLSGFAVIENAR